MIEIGKGKLRTDFVGCVLDIRFPIGFGSSEIELLFVFQSSQRIQLGIVRLGLDEIGERRARLAGRAAESHSAAWQ